MHHLTTTSWEEVFSGWTSREASNPDWIACATEVKGWPDWKSWRSFSASQLGLPDREWSLYQFDDVLLEVPAMLVGPFVGFQSRCPGRDNTSTFADLLSSPDQQRRFLGDARIQSMLEAIPFETQMIGLLRESDDRVICLDGHHRTTAITLASSISADFSSTPVTIALAKLGKDEESLLDRVLETGTSFKSDR